MRVIDYAKRLVTSSLIPLAALLLSFLVCTGLLLLYNVNPLVAFKALFKGALGSKTAISETLSVATPLILAGLGFAFGQRCMVFNIGAEGQIYMGALGAALTALFMPELPKAFALLLIIVAGIVFGMLWILIPAVLRACYGINEIVTTVMLNQVAIYFVSFLVRNPLKDPIGPLPQTPMFPESFRYPILLSGSKIHFGLVIAVVAVVVVWFILHRTTFGLQTLIVGESPKAAEYAGISVSKTIIGALLVSGGLAGLAGAGEVCGIHYRLLDHISAEYGYMAIVVALLGKGNPLGVLVSAILFAVLLVGANAMQRTVGTPIALAYIVQAVTVLFFISSEYLVPKLMQKRKKASELVSA